MRDNATHKNDTPLEYIAVANQAVDLFQKIKSDQSPYLIAADVDHYVIYQALQKLDLQRKARTGILGRANATAITVTTRC